MNTYPKYVSVMDENGNIIKVLYRDIKEHEEIIIGQKIIDYAKQAYEELRELKRQIRENPNVVLKLDETTERYVVTNLQGENKMKKWILIDYNFRDKLPKENCKLWITRTMCTGERWVQKIDFYARDKDIEWDGTIAWMIAEENEKQPEPCNSEYVITIQNVR